MRVRGPLPWLFPLTIHSIVARSFVNRRTAGAVIVAAGRDTRS